MRINREKTLFTIIFILMVCVVYIQPSLAQTQEDESIKAVREQIEKRQQKKETKLKDEPRIKKVKESLLELEDIYKKEGKEGAKKHAEKHLFSLQNDCMVRVDIHLAIPSESFDDKLFESLGGKINAKFRGIIDALIPIGAIRDVIDKMEVIQYIDVPRGRPVPLSESEGVQKTGASAYLAAHYYGAGVKVAVIDTAFGGLTNAIQAGELPAAPIGMAMIACYNFSCSPSDFSTDPPANSLATKWNNHGTAVAEIVHDMAPSAQLYLFKYDKDRDLVAAVEYCRANGIKIINFSVASYDSNFLTASALMG